MIVAVTGVILIVFVIGHLLGNLQIFLGPDWINGYSQHLRDLGPLLWAIRVFLLGAVIIHIYVTIQLAIENRQARPERYVDRHYVKADFASRHMVISGLITRSRSRRSTSAASRPMITRSRLRAALSAPCAVATSDSAAACSALA